MGARLAQLGDPTSGTRARLVAVCLRLSRFLSGSEQVFLDTGNRLQTLQQGALGLVETSSAAALVSDDGDAVPSDLLRQELERTRHHLDVSQRSTTNGSDGLAKLLSRLARLHDFRDGYVDVAGSLRAIAMQTKIQSACTAAQMETVATEARVLAGQIEPQFDNVLNQATDLHAAAAAARERALAFLSQQGARGPKLVADTRAGVEALQGLATSASGLVTKACATAGRVSTRVSDVLVGLQSHDSTRQMIEHVAEELGSLAGDLDESGPAFFSEAAALCRLEARQLSVARTRLVSGLTQVSNGLLDLAGDVAELTDEAKRMASGNATELVHEVERDAGDAARLLIEQIAAERELHAAIHTVNTALQGMAGCVSQIEQIGRQLKLLSLNAMVESAQVRAGGRVFNALSREMSECADGVRKHNAVVIAALEQVFAEVRTLKRDDDVIAADGSSASASNFEQVAAKLALWHQRLAEQVDQLQQGSAALGAAAAETRTGLSAHLMTTHALAEIEEELSRLADFAEAAVGPNAGHYRSKRLDAAAARYTMESEREVHSAGSHSHGAAAGARAELSAPPPLSGELGENVELF